MKYTASLITFFLLCGTLFGQTENFWSVKSDFGGLKRERAVAFTANGMAFVGTGVDTSEAILNDFWSYDVVSDTWAQVANLPGVARRDAIAFTINDKGYVGTGMDNADANLGSALNDFWQYDPLTNSWTQKSNYPGLPVYFATGFNIDTKGYICGGKRGPNWYISELWEYNPASDSWTGKTPFPGGVRYQLNSFVVGSSAYVGLGTDQDMYRYDMYEYKPALDEWTPKADLPASARGASHLFAIGNRGFVCMGTNGGFLDDLWEYNPLNNTWAIRATYGGSPRKNGIAFVLGGKAYVGTGKGASGKKMSMWEYTPSALVGVNENTEADIRIYPNPSSGNFSLNVTSTEIELLEIYTLQGTRVMETSFTTSVDVSELSSGTYLLVGKDSFGQIIGKEKLIIH